MTSTLKDSITVPGELGGSAEVPPLRFVDRKTFGFPQPKRILQYRAIRDGKTVWVDVPFVEGEAK